MSDDEESESTKKYNTKERKKLVTKIESLKKKKHYINIFNIINNENVKYTENSNGIFIVINNLSDDTLQLVEDYVTKVNLKRVDMSDSSESYHATTGTATATESTLAMKLPRLSNKEKQLLNKIKQYSET